MTADSIAGRKLVFPGVGRLYDALAPLSYSLMRVALGLILMPHGINKLFFGDALNAANTMAKLGLAPPLFWAYVVGVLECVGGAMLVLGLLTRLVALAFVIEMLIISFGVLWPHWWWGGRGMEYTILMGVLSLAILFRGGGRYALDAVIGKEI